MKHHSNFSTFTGQSMNISSLDVRSMLPENLNHFFRYQGSLTTPPCYESILWTVFDTPITLSHNQVKHAGRDFVPVLRNKNKVPGNAVFFLKCHTVSSAWSFVYRSGSWRVLSWTWTTKPCGTITALLRISTTVWWSLLSCHVWEKEVCNMS